MAQHPSSAPPPPAAAIKAIPLSTETGTPDSKAPPSGPGTRAAAAAASAAAARGEGEEGGGEKTEFVTHKKRFMGKQRSEYFDPCQEAASRSLRCLARNQQDKEICNDYFQAYRDCKQRFIQELKEEKKRRGGWLY